MMRQKIQNTEIDDAVLTLSQKDAARLESPLNRSGALWFRGIFVVALCLLGARVFFLNVIEGTKYREQASRNSVRNVLLPAPRGLIFDRYGKQLVRNIPSMELIAFPPELPHSVSERKVLLEKLRSFVSLDDPDPSEAFLAADVLSEPIVLKLVLSQDESLIFSSRSAEFPGIAIERSAVRKYEDSAIFSHIIGYEGKIQEEERADHPDYLLIDSIGKQGVEKVYEPVLRGERGAGRFAVDAKGIIRKEIGTSDSKPGADLILNIDADLQKKSFDTLRAELDRKGLFKGVVIAIDPRDGSVLALVSLPSFDNNLFAGGIDFESYASLLRDPSMPLFNRAISGEYPPGSTIKPFLAAAALAEGIVNVGTTIESRGGISVAGFSFGDWKAHGFTDLRRAIAVSSDVYFYSIGGGYGNIRGLGMEKMNAYESQFGFGTETGIDLPNEKNGFLPTPEWKQEKFGERWFVGDTYHAAIGQGFVLATPLQIANATAAVANGGTLWTPRIVGSIRSLDGSTQLIQPVALRRNIVEARILETVREGMRMTVTEGTALSLRDLPVAVAGKTGTAQFGSEGKTYGWLSSFAPFDHPTIALIVLFEDQDTETYNAVPVAREIYSWYFSDGRGNSQGSRD